MMVKLNVFFLPLLFASPALADDEAPEFARTASEFAKAVEAGSDISALDQIPALSPIEYAELGRLAGCDGWTSEGSDRKMVIFQWRCDDETASPGLTRSTMLLFDDDGELYGVGVNPLYSDFAPSEAALKAEKLPSRYKLARSFAKAVVEGGDPSMGGLLTLGEYERSRLEPFRGGTFNVSSHSDNGARKVWLRKDADKTSEREILTLHFDSDGRPTGVFFSPTYSAKWQRKGDYHGNLFSFPSNRMPANNSIKSKCGIC